MKRSAFKRRAGAKTLKPKSRVEKAARTRRRKAANKGTVGRSFVAKGPARSAEHLAKVRKQPCLLCENTTTIQTHPTQAHHVRCVGPRTLGVRVSDYLTVPLCAFDHTLLHQDKEELFWREWGIDPRDFIRSFSKEGARELEALENKK